MKNLKQTGLKIAFALSILIGPYFFGQNNKCITSLEDFQYMSWAFDQPRLDIHDRYAQGKPFTNHIENKYFFTYTPVYSKERNNCFVRYALVMENRITKNRRLIGIPVENPNEFENLFNELMSWTDKEKVAFIKSYILFQNRLTP
ncbi:hypothetical protein PG291_00335 [Riemerella anatipestifer]|nr:hypothetical protein [Riemerella anatipestifer]